jgi:cytochrome c oxidase subunit 2
MQKNVRVVSEAEYKEWLAAQTPYLTNDLRKAFNLPIPVEAAPAATEEAPAADTTATAAAVKLDVKNQLALKK